jgi:YggT family protein
MDLPPTAAREALPRMNDSFFLYHLPNLLLAMAMYTLIGRFVLSFIFAPDNQAAFWRVFQQISDPLIVVTAIVTPAVVPRLLLPLVGFVWAFLLRVGWFLIAVMYGFAPTVGG